MTVRRQKSLANTGNIDEFLQDSAKKFELVAEASKEGIVFADARGKIVSANRRMAELLGYPAGKLTGKSYFKLISKESLAALKDKLKGSREMANEQIELLFSRKDGSVFTGLPLLPRSLTTPVPVPVFYRWYRKWQGRKTWRTPGRKLPLSSILPATL